MNLVEELRWRGMIHDVMPGTEEMLNKGQIAGYVGFDPTASSLTIGNLVTIMLLVHLQRAGHKPIALIGGATGMIGDPSGKSEERNLLSLEVLKNNQDAARKQLEKFLDFNSGSNAAEIVNNYDWISKFSFLDFLRDVGKYLTVSYMMAKDSVKNRMETGISFTEFSYQLIQGYDFYWLYEHKGCKLQMGGSDQWGNITSGTELIRRINGGEAFALTCPLITKADGTKFGKSEGGNVWLDPKMTSPYKFYQFWLNCADEEAAKYLRIFTLKDRAEIEALEKEHAQAPHTRIMQKALAEDITIRVHSQSDLDAAIKASELLFGNSTTEALKDLSEELLLNVFEGVPQFRIDKNKLSPGISVVELMATESAIFPSKGEAKKMIQGGGVSINKNKVLSDAELVSVDGLLNGKYLLVQKGKKNYYMLIVE